jgi:hypothetical protein
MLILSFKNKVAIFCNQFYLSIYYYHLAHMVLFLVDLNGMSMDMSDPKGKLTDELINL